MNTKLIKALSKIDSIELILSCVGYSAAFKPLSSSKNYFVYPGESGYNVVMHHEGKTDLIMGNTVMSDILNFAKSL